jgi:6-phosphogluconolactonase
VTISTSEIYIAEDIQALSRRAAEVILAAIVTALKTKSIFTLVLSAGSTPKRLYALLATDPAFKDQMPWERVHFFWGDERHVSPDHHDSNYRMVNKSMLSRLPVPRENVHGKTFIE